MRVGDNSEPFRTSLGEGAVRGIGLTGTLLEEQTLHSLLSAPADSSHISAYLDAFEQVGITSFTPPLTLSNINVEPFTDGVGHLVLDLPLQGQDSEGNNYTYVLMRLHRGITHFEFPFNRETPQHPANVLQMMVQGSGEIPVAGHVRFLVPFEMPVNALSNVSLLGMATSPLGAAVEHGILHILRIKLTNWVSGAEKAAAEAIAKWADSKINPSPGMKWFKPQFPPMTPNEIQSLSGKPTLLFVHGIISSIENAFSGVLQDPQLSQFIAKKYGSNVIGFDHYTLSETQLDTAKELVAILPVGASLDIICHSRGAAVVRGLLEHPQVVPMLGKKRITVNKVVYVAGANAGTPIAHMDNYKTFINVISFIASLVPPGVAKVIAKAIAALLKVALDMVSELDSLTMLDPGSTFYRTIGAVASSPANEYMFMRAAYDLRQKSAVLAYLLNQIMPGPNDIVIPWGSAGEFHARPRSALPTAIQEFNPQATPQSTVYHTNFFVQPATWSALIMKL